MDPVRCTLGDNARCMDGLENVGVSVGLTLDDVIGDLIDVFTLGILVEFNLGEVVGVISGVGVGVDVGIGVGSTLGNDAKIKFV